MSVDSEIEQAVNNFAFAIANEAINDFRCDKLPVNSKSYALIKSKISWYNETTEKIYSDFKTSQGNA